MHFTQVVAYSALTRLIGVGSQIPWNLKSDFLFFRSYTMGKIVILGRKTFESIPVFLDGRSLIVVGEHGLVQAHVGRLKNSFPDVPVPWICSSSNIIKSIKIAEDLIENEEAPSEVVVAGGRSVYEQLLPVCDSVIATVVDYKSPILSSDVYYVKKFLDCNWKRSIHDPGSSLRDDKDSHEYSRFLYERDLQNVIDIKTKKSICPLDRYIRLMREVKKNE